MHIITALFLLVIGAFLGAFLGTRINERKREKESKHIKREFSLVWQAIHQISDQAFDFIKRFTSLEKDSKQIEYLTGEVREIKQKLEIKEHAMDAWLYRSMNVPDISPKSMNCSNLSTGVNDSDSFITAKSIADAREAIAAKKNYLFFQKGKVDNPLFSNLNEHIEFVLSDDRRLAADSSFIADLLIKYMKKQNKKAKKLENYPVIKAMKDLKQVSDQSKGDNIINVNPAHIHLPITKNNNVSGAKIDTTNGYFHIKYYDGPEIRTKLALVVKLIDEYTANGPKWQNKDK